jgi:hypothetical protein
MSPPRYLPGPGGRASYNLMNTDSEEHTDKLCYYHYAFLFILIIVHSDRDSGIYFWLLSVEA